jgi:hypothetical protein
LARTSQNAVKAKLAEGYFCEVGCLMARSLAKAARFRSSLRTSHGCHLLDIGTGRHLGADGHDPVCAHHADRE